MRNTIFDETSWPNDNAMDHHIALENILGVLLLLQVRFDLLLDNLGEVEVSSYLDFYRLYDYIKSIY